MVGGTDEQGAAAVEFALVLPLLALILFGIIQFGLVYLQTQGLEGAAREAGRHASVGGSYQDVGDAVIAALSGLEGELSVTVEFADAFVSTDDTTETFTIAADGSFTPPSGGPCTDNGDVTVTINDANMSIVIPLWGSEDITYQANTTFRCESLYS